jgi:hypothetical protein
MSTLPMKQDGFGVPINGGYGIPDDVYKNRSERKRKLAEALRKQTTNPQGQMVGGIYVAPSITQYLATGLQGYKANQLEKEADQDYDTGVKQKQERTSTAMQKYLEALRPQSVQTGETKQPFEANQMDRFGTPMQGQQQPTTPVMGQRQPTPEEMYAAQMNFASELQDPNAMMQAANSRMGYMEKQQGREDEQSFRQDQLAAQQQQRMLELQYKSQDAALSRQEQAQARMELAEMNNAARGDMVRLAASLRPPTQAPQAQIIDTPQGKMRIVNGQAVPLTTADGQQVAGVKPKSALSATAQKELFEAEDIAQASNNATGMLKEALTLNNKAYSGIGAKPRAIIASNLGMGKGGADDTINLDNLMTGQALESLKATFGGMPTEGERKILLDMQASADKTPTQRKAILDRAIIAADKRAKFNQTKAKSLRSGDYFLEEPQSTGGVRTVDW